MAFLNVNFNLNVNVNEHDRVQVFFSFEVMPFDFTLPFAGGSDAVATGEQFRQACYENNCENCQPSLASFAWAATCAFVSMIYRA